MNEGEREEIVQYAEKESSFYDWSSKRYEAVGDYNFFERYLKDFLEDNVKVIDIGCGDGKTLDRISDRIEKGFGVELDQEHYGMAVDRNRGNDNIEIIKQDATDPLKIDEKVDLIFSERGPVNHENIEIIKDNLIKDGVLLVEVIGEQDERVFKEIMGYGQGYGEWDEKSRSSKVREMLQSNGFKVLYVHNHFYFHYYKDIVRLFKNHHCAPAIEFKGNEEELKKLEKVEKRLKTERGIKMLRHRVVYAGRKNGE